MITSRRKKFTVAQIQACSQMNGKLMGVQGQSLRIICFGIALQATQRLC